MHVKPCQDHKTDHKQHTHIMEHQPVERRIKQFIEYQNRKYRKLLEGIEKQVFQFPGLDTDRQKAGKMYEK
jgi:molybdopterin-guanine dinucleotide biosynthesis protein A